MQPVRRPVAYLYLVLAMALWGAGPVVVRGVHEIAPPFALTFWRWLGVALMLLPFVWNRVARELPPSPSARRQVALICAYMVAGSTLSVVAVSYTTAINATVINATQPAVTALAAFLVFAERLTRFRFLGVVAAFIGILIMAFQASFQALLQLSVNSGDLIMFVAVCCWSLYAISLHRATELPGTAVLLFLIAVSGAILGLPLYVAESLLDRPFLPTPQTIGAVIFLAVGVSLFAVHFWNSAIRTVGANRAAIFVNLIPVFGAAFAIGFLDERLFAYHLVGAGLVVAGIFLAVRPSRPAQRSGTP